MLMILKRVFPWLMVAFFIATFSTGYYLGGEAEQQVQELRTSKILLRAAQEAERIREHDIKLIMEARDRETTIVERIRNVPVNVPTPECTTLGDEWLQQYNDVIETINSRKHVD